MNRVFKKTFFKILPDEKSLHDGNKICRRKLLCELSKLSKLNAFILLRYSNDTDRYINTAQREQNTQRPLLSLPLPCSLARY